MPEARCPLEAAFRLDRRQTVLDAKNSPILTNLSLHHGFDMWSAQTWPAIPFEQYADDAICHCRTRDEAEALQAALQTGLCRLPAGASPAEDEDRLLQGHQPEGMYAIRSADRTRGGAPSVLYFVSGHQRGKSGRPGEFARSNVQRLPRLASQSPRS
jgi:hypothetical protein